jgi:hypothetical protein
MIEPKIAKKLTREGSKNTNSSQVARRLKRIEMNRINTFIRESSHRRFSSIYSFNIADFFEEEKRHAGSTHSMHLLQQVEDPQVRHFPVQAREDLRYLLGRIEQSTASTSGEARGASHSNPSVAAAPAKEGRVRSATMNSTCKESKGPQIVTGLGHLGALIPSSIYMRYKS